MAYYRMNNNAQLNGDHEVHRQGCYWWPTANYTSLGDHPNCYSAVAAARAHHYQVNGCYFCSNECHTG